MKRNSWKRLLAILGSASILTVSINPVRINAGGSDLPIVSADVEAETEEENTVDTASEDAETAPSSEQETSSETEVSPVSSGEASDTASGDAGTSAQGSETHDTSDAQSDAYPASDAGMDTAAGNTENKDGSDGTESSTEAGEEKTRSIHVTYQSADETMGTVTLAEEDGTTQEGSEEVTFAGSTAKPNEGYEFVDWTVEEDGGTVEVSTEEALIPANVTEDTVYTANFEKKEDKSKTITITYAAGEGGTVSRESEHFQTGSDTAVTLDGSTAEAEDGYAFLGWVKGEDSGTARTYVSTDAAFTPDVSEITEDTTYTAVFEKKTGEKAEEFSLADSVESLKVYYRTASDETWTEAVITGESLTSIPQTAELKFDFTLKELTEAGDYTYTIPEFLTGAAAADGAFSLEGSTVTSTVEISTAESNAESTDSSETSALTLHLSREDAAAKLTGAHLVLTAKPDTAKLTTTADRTRPLTFGDRTYTLTFASRVLRRMAAVSNAAAGINIAEMDENRKAKYITGAQISWQNGSTWTSVSSETLIPLNVPFRITVNYSGIKTQDLIDQGGVLNYDIPDLLENPYVANGTIMNGQEVVGTISASGTRITIALKSDYLKSILNQDGESSTIENASFTFMATPDPDKVRKSYNQTLVIGDISTDLHFDPNYDSVNGTLNLTKSDPTYIEENGTSYLQYTLTITNGDASMPDVTVKDYFSSNAGAIEGYLGVPTDTALTLSDTASTVQPYETITGGGDAPSRGTVQDSPKDTAPGILWTIGTMQPKEQRTLTYRVQLKSGYAGAASAANGTVTNTATPASGSNKRSSVSSTFTPRTSATVSKRAGSVQITDTQVIIPYTVTVTASSANTWTLRNVKISDDFGIANTNISKSAIRSALLEDGGSWTDFKIYSGTSAAGTYVTAEKKDQEDTSFTAPYFVVKPGNENPGFNLYIGDLAKGESRTITFNVVLKKSILDKAAGTSDSTVQVGNRAGAYSDDTNTTYGNQTLGAGNTYSTLTSQKWDRKIQGTPLTEKITQAAPDSAYTLSGSTWSLSSSTEAKTIPSGSVQYQVVVNEKGQWNVSSSIFQDALSGNGEALHYAGYLRVDYYADGLGENASYTSDQAAAVALSALTPTDTFWLDIDDQSSFSFTPSSLSAALGRGAYLLTYYAKPVNAAAYSKVTTGNSFTLSGSVIGPGGTTKTLAGVQVSTSIVLSGEVDFGASKTAWYGDIQDTAVDGTTDVKFNRGSLYWIIEVNGSKIPQGTQLQDTPRNSSVYGDIKGVSHVSIAGVYLSSVESAESLASQYTAFSQIKNNDAFTLVPDTDSDDSTANWSWSVGNGSGVFTFEKDMELDGKQLYIIVRSEPTSTAFSSSSTSTRRTATFSNSLSMRNSTSAAYTSVNTASMKVAENGSNFKEVADYGSYSAATKSWSNVTQVMDGNDPADRILTSWTTAGRTASLVSGTYIDYRLIVNYAGNEEGTLRVEDVVPDGMEPVYVRYFWTSPNQSADTRPEMVPISSLPEGTWEEIGVKNAALNGSAKEITKSAYAYYDAGTGKIIFDVGNLNRGPNASNVDTMDIQVQIVMRVTDPAALLGKGATFTNTMNVYNTDGSLVNTSTTSTAIRITDSLSKSMSDLTSSNLNFTLTVNPRGEDLLAGTDYLTLVDSYSSNLVIDPSTIHVKENASDTEDVSFTVQMDAANHTMTLVIPDSKTLVITYTAALQAAFNVSADVSNAAHWYGYSSTSESEVSGTFTLTAGGTIGFGSNPQIRITKVDSLNADTKLQGAVFDLYEAKLGPDGKSFQSTGKLIAEGTTDENGILTFAKTMDSKSLQYNTVYCIEEKTAPAGYIRSTEPIYVGVFRTVTVDGTALYPKTWGEENPTADNCWTLTDLQSWTNVSIHYTDYLDKITWPNSRTKVVIEKSFFKEDGSSMDFPNGTYSFGLYYNGVQVQKLTIANTNGTKQYQLTTNGVTAMVDQAEFNSLNTNDTYKIYELDDTGNPVSDGRLVYTNGTQYTVSYPNGSSTITTGEAESQTFAISNTQFTIPTTGISVPGSRAYLAGAAVLAGVFAAYVLWMRRSRT